MSKLLGVTTLVVVIAAAVAIASLVLNIIILGKVKDNEKLPAVVTPEVPPPAEDSCLSGVTPNNDWKEVADRLLDCMDDSVDPCEDFYQFTCGKYLAETDLQGESRKGTYDETQHNINRDLAQYVIDNVPAIGGGITNQLQNKFLTICKKAAAEDHATLPIVNKYMGYFDTDIKATLGFPLVGVAALAADFKAIFTKMGEMQLQYSGGPLLTSIVTSDYGDNTANALYVSQPALPMARDFYVLPQFISDLMSHTDDVERALNAYVAANGYGTEASPLVWPGLCRAADTAPECVRKVAEYVVAFERQIAMASWPDTEMRNYKQQYNPIKLGDLNTRFPGIGLEEYVKGFTGVDDTYTGNIIITQPSYFASLNNLFESGNVNIDVITNFLAVEFIVENAGAMNLDIKKAVTPPTKRRVKVDHETSKWVPYPLRRGVGARRISRKPHNSRAFTDDPVEQQNVDCFDMLVNYAPFAAGYTYVKIVDDHNAIQKDIKDQTERIIASFNEQIDSLDWMTDDSKAAAHAKSTNDNLIRNYGWPSYYDLADTSSVDAYHVEYTDLAGLNVNRDTYWTAFKKLMEGYESTEAVTLLFRAGDRGNFLMSPAIVNAWYQPERNSITFPLGILNPPYYNLNYPQAYNYAGQGGTGGHELTHGYDDEGIQFGPDGQLVGSKANFSSKCTFATCGIMDDESRMGFTDMAQCVVTQYNMQCCPLKSGNVRCVNGLTTQGENIADIGGELAAYRAYNQYVKENNVESRLPGLEKYTPNQIFWISYGVTWCMKITDERLQRQLMTDPHSPSYCRVNQVIQDLPQFGRDFKCKKGVSPMYPADADRCEVWTGN